jgi:diguanylate cyclase
MSAVLKQQQPEKTICRILVVDDDQRMAESLQKLLLTQGHDVDTVFGGRAALHQLSQDAYDLVLLDLSMPDLNGHAVLHHMKQHNINALCIVVSGERSFNDVSQALRNGAYDYLRKPFATDELLTTIINAANKKKLQDSHSAMQQKLIRSEQLHRFMVEHSPDIIFVLDAQGHFSYLNQKVEGLLGYSQESLLGEPISSIVHPDYREKSGLFYGRHASPG